MLSCSVIENLMTLSYLHARPNDTMCRKEVIRIIIIVNHH